MKKLMTNAIRSTSKSASFPFHTYMHLQLNGEKMKSMSKKQLRQVKKTQMNANGAVELVDVYGGGKKDKKRR